MVGVQLCVCVCVRVFLRVFFISHGSLESPVTKPFYNDTQSNCRVLFVCFPPIFRSMS